MSPSLPLSGLCWFLLLVLLFPATTSRAQPGLIGSQETPQDQRQRARARFEATRADPHQLAQERRDTARQAYLAAWADCKSGKVGSTIEQVRTWALRWLEAERALIGSDTDLMRCLERYRRQAQALEEQLRRSKNVPWVSQLLGHYARLEADLTLAQTPQGKGQKAVTEGVDLSREEGDGLASSGARFRELAKARFAITQSQPQQLQQELEKTARAGFDLECYHFLSGGQNLTTEPLFAWLQRLQQAGAALQSDPRQQLWQRWLQTWQTEQKTLTSQLAGHIGLDEYLEGRYRRLMIERDLLATANQVRKGPGFLDVIPPLTNAAEPLGPQSLLRDRLQMTRTNPHQLSLDILQVARDGLSAVPVSARAWRPEANRKPLTVWFVRLQSAKQAARPDRTEPLLLLNHLFDTARQEEGICQARSGVGRRLEEFDYWEARYHRLGVQLRLLQALSQGRQK